MTFTLQTGTSARIGRAVGSLTALTEWATSHARVIPALLEMDLRVLVRWLQ